jgi:hypothetical protein
LRMGMLHVGEKLGACAHQMGTPPQESTRGPHIRWLDIGFREHAPSEQRGTLV